MRAASSPPITQATGTTSARERTTDQFYVSFSLQDSNRDGKVTFS